jgi:hypothetical protein
VKGLEAGDWGLEPSNRGRRGTHEGCYYEFEPILL